MEGVKIKRCFSVIGYRHATYNNMYTTSTSNNNNLEKNIIITCLPLDRRSVVLHTLELQQFCTKTKNNWNVTKLSGKMSVNRGFNKGQASGKLAICDDNFGHLV